MMEKQDTSRLPAIHVKWNTLGTRGVPQNLVQCQLFEIIKGYYLFKVVNIHTRNDSILDLLFKKGERPFCMGELPVEKAK